MVQAALNAVDVEIRPTLLNNIVLTGGGSLLDKLAERLHSELSTLYPNPRVRVHASNIVTDRKYGSWVGGSILASLGTFHQVGFVLQGIVQITILTFVCRCGYPKRSTKSTARASSRSDANNETRETGEQAFLGQSTAHQNQGMGWSAGNTIVIEAKTRFIFLKVVDLRWLERG